MPTSERNYRNFSYQSQRRLPVEKSKNRKPLRIVAVFALVFFIGVVGKGVFATGESPETENAVLAHQDEVKPAPKKTVDTATLKPALDKIIKKYPYDTSVSVVELNSGTLIQSGDSYPFLAASTTKILTALAFMQKVEKGEAKMSDKIGGVPATEMMQKMINESDNPSWKTLNGFLGDDGLKGFAQKQGLASYESERNVISSNDMALLLSKVYKREIINDEHTKLLLSWMQNTSEERFIPAAIPSGTSIYHKAGYLEDRAHDVAIVDNGSTPYVLVIYSKSYTPGYNFLSGQKLFKEATTQVNQIFSQ